MKEMFSSLFDILIHPKHHAKVYLTAVMIVFIPLTYLLVHWTGGIKFVYSHTMYIPIVVLAIIYGTTGGLLAALVGGLLLGPLMAIDVSTGEAQDLLNWIYRLLIFMVIGGTVGLFASRIRRQSEKLKGMALKSAETNLLLFTKINDNFNDPLYMEKYREETYVFSMVNGSEIIELLGKDFYNTLIIESMEQMVEHFEQKVALFQIDTTKFVLLVEHDVIKDVSEALMKFFDNAFTIKDIPIHLSIVVGISTTDHDIFKRVEEAILATNTAKENHVQVSTFDEGILPSTIDLSIVGAFKEALTNGDLYLVYQPVHDITTNKVVSLESLIRWNHADHGLLLPGKFIHLIENTQLINHLSEFVIKEAFRILQLLDEDVSISVNLSANNFYSRFFVNKIFDILKKEDKNCERMIFEITESVLMEHPKKSVEIMNKFKSNGIRFAIDDFGTGYSSLAYINLFPIDHLKIDRYFIEQMHKKSVHNIIKSTIELAHDLHIDVVAEGVEKTSDIEILSSLHCDYVQGYSKSVPLKESNILRYIKENVVEESS